MTDHWELLDVYKALLAIAAGIILGLERELKDKAAGLKTITIICLGAALFSIISYKVGAGADNTAIAAYIVSGVGFIGAGAIFKDGFSISGLTTAGIIWLAAAVGTAIGFGEFYLAGTFIAGSLVVIFITPFINNVFRSKKLTRQLSIIINKNDKELRENILGSIRKANIFLDERKLQLKDDKLEIQVEVVLDDDKVKWLQEYLLSLPAVVSFSF